MDRPAPTWSIRPGTPDDGPALRRLFAEVFGVERSEGHQRWKFDDNPAGPQILAVAVDGDAIVGQYALWPSRLHVGREVVQAAQSLDTMTHPDYRGQGMFTRLAREAMGYAADRGIEVLYGFPNAASYPGFVTKLDWDHTGDVARYVRVLAPSRHDRVPAWLGPVVDAAARAIPLGSNAATSTLVPEVDEVADLVARAVGDSWTVSIVRDPTYLAWRYGEASGMHYRWTTTRDPGGALTAVAIWGTELRSGRAVLSEWVAATPEAGAAVLARTIRDARDSGHSELIAFGQRPNLAAALHRAGFVRRGGLPLIVRKLTGRVIPGNVHTHGGWAVFGSDLDTF